MGSDQKHVGISETSSDDQEETSHNSTRPASDGSKDGLGRSYECTFCKRGFTNAQALGGHMNIHRKDKARAKKHHDVASSAKQPNKDHSIVSSSGSFNLIPNEADAHQYYLGSSFGFHSTAGDHRQLITPAAASNPNFHWSSLAAASQTDINNSHALVQEEDLRVNLNLRVGTSSSEITNKIGQDWYHDQNDVDLELRLGHYP